MITYTKNDVAKMFKISRTTLYRHMEKNNIHKNSKLTDKEIAILKQSIKPTLTLGHESCMSKEDHEQTLNDYKMELQLKFEQMNNQIVELEEQLSFCIKQNEKLITDGVTKIEYIIKRLEANNRADSEIDLEQLKQEVEVFEPVEGLDQEVEVAEPVEGLDQEVEVAESVEALDQEVELEESIEQESKEFNSSVVEDKNKDTDIHTEQSATEEQELPQKNVTKKKRWWKR